MEGVTRQSSQYQVHSVTSVCSVSRCISQKVRRYSLDVMKVLIIHKM